MTSFAVKASIIDDFRFGYATVAVRVGCFEETKIKGTLIYYYLIRSLEPIST